MYWADIKIMADEWQLAGIPFGELQTDMRLYPDHYEIRSAHSTSLNDEIVDVHGNLDWSSGNSLTFDLEPSTLDARLLKHYFGEDCIELAGVLELEGNLLADRAGSAAGGEPGTGQAEQRSGIQSRASGTVFCKSLQVDELRGQNISADLVLDGYHLELQHLRGSLAGGNLDSHLQIELDRREINFDFQAQQAQLESLARDYRSRLSAIDWAAAGTTGEAPQRDPRANAALDQDPESRQGLPQGQVDATGGFKLQLSPFQLETHGEVVVSKLAWRDLPELDGQAAFILADDQLRIDDLRLELSQVPAASVGEIGAAAGPAASSAEQRATGSALLEANLIYRLSSGVWEANYELNALPSAASPAIRQSIGWRVGRLAPAVSA